MSPPVALLCSRPDNKIIGQTAGAGKFQISLASILFTLIEKQVVRGLREAYEDLLTKIGDSIPFLSTTRILLDIHLFSAKQTVSVSNFSSDFVDKFKNLVVPGLALQMSSGVAEKMQDLLSPTMDRMVGSLDSLQAATVGNPR